MKREDTPDGLSCLCGHVRENTKPNQFQCGLQDIMGVVHLIDKIVYLIYLQYIGSILVILLYTW